MNITDASTPNGLNSSTTIHPQPCLDQADEHIDRRPRIVDGRPARPFVFASPVACPSTIPMANAQTLSAPDKAQLAFAPESDEGEPVAPKLHVGGSTPSVASPDASSVVNTGQSEPRQSVVRGQPTVQQTEPKQTGPAVDPTVGNEGCGADKTQPCIEQPLVAPIADGGVNCARPKSSENSEFCILNFALEAPAFPRFPGETPRAYSAFMTFFQLGHARSLPAVAEKLGLGVDAVKKWSSRFDWNERIQSFNTGILQQQVNVETEVHKKMAEELAIRTAKYREQEWQSSQKLWQIVECCIANFGDAELEKVRLGDIARTLQIATNVSRSALQIAMPKDDQPQRSHLQDEFRAALERVYGESSKKAHSEQATTTAPVRS